MEAEVIRMTCELFGQEKEGIGVLTSGGTESIVLAVLAHRNWARDTKGIHEPNLYSLMFDLKSAPRDCSSGIHPSLLVLLH
jgi:glutamate/tyrosine decarboxylase-like PLP-dependent enzyme